MENDLRHIFSSSNNFAIEFKVMTGKMRGQAFITFSGKYKHLKKFNILISLV